MPLFVQRASFGTRTRQTTPALVALLFAALLAGLPRAARAACGYGNVSTSYNWIQIEALGGTRLTTISACDDCGATYTLPFPISFHCDSFSNAAISSNGFVAINSPPSWPYTRCAMLKFAPSGARLTPRRVCVCACAAPIPARTVRSVRSGAIGLRAAVRLVATVARCGWAPSETSETALASFRG